MRGRLLLTFVLAAFVCAAPLRAQSPQPEPDAVAPAHVAHVEGAVSLEREGRAENAPLNMPLLSGDRLRTADGRVEVLFADGSTLHLDVRSTIDVQSDDLVRLTDGRLRLNILGPAGTVAYRIDSPAGSARITQPGEYRIALLSPSTELRAGGKDGIQLEVAVVRGAAEVFTDQGTMPVRAGERAYASAGLAPSYPYSFNSANWDAFDRWSEARRDVRLGVSSQYLPEDMQAYAPLLDESGDWRQTESYGYAWYPRVSPDWRPYYYGRWASYPRYGWTWIGADRFAWPTHHYGRWGFSAGVWFWMPSSRWAPAYVSWAYAPGYVSWCPLGFDNRPIIAINVGSGRYSPWRAWTAVSYSHFGGRGFSVNQRAVNWDRVDRGQRPRFETRPSPPGFARDVAVPRNSTPIRWAGSRVTPGGGSRGMSRGNEGQPISRGGTAPPRDGSSRQGSSRDNASAPSGDRRGPGDGQSGGRDVAVPRTGPTPRYVNRGDEIVRSQTERPTPPAPREGARPFDPSRASRSPRAESGSDGAQSRPAREGYAVPRDSRTIPERPAQPSRPEFDRAPFDPAQGRPFDPSRASGAPRTESRDDGAASRPRGLQRPSGQPSQPRTYEPVDQAQGSRPRGGYDVQRPQRPAPERAAPPAPSRVEGAERPSGRIEGRQPTAERAPSRGEGRQPPPERAAPPPRSAPAAGGGGVAAPRRGRGGV